MRPRFSICRDPIHSLNCRSLKRDVSCENIIEILFYNTILKFINIFLIDIL
jgi:hypothetical protein